MSEDKSQEVFEDTAEDEDLDLEEMKEVNGGFSINRNSMLGSIIGYISDSLSDDSNHTGGATGTW